MASSTDFEDMLKLYYKRIFPYDSYCKWLGAGNVDRTFLGRREFCFTLAGDIYLRYLSFANHEELRAEMVRRLPHKVDIGAVYNVRPCDHTKVRDFQPVEKELVFDIDMTDYDEVRTCCQGASVCPKCWQFMSLAVRVLHTALEEDFGFKNLLWVFSGRRGIHCWVSDPSARRLGSAARAAVAEYLQLLSGGDSKSKKVHLRGERAHPSVERAIAIVRERFPKLCLEDQDILGTPERYEKVLKLIPNEELRNEIRKEFSEPSSSVARWNFLIDKLTEDSKSKNPKVSKRTHEEIMLQFAYPRLDINVSKGLNHLLKSPFCVHPKTGRVCVPIDPKKVDQFNPENAPTISQLASEIDKFAKDESSKVVSKDYKKTSMRESMKIFDEFLANLSENWKGERMKQSDMSMEF